MQLPKISHCVLIFTFLFTSYTNFLCEDLVSLRLWLEEDVLLYNVTLKNYVKQSKQNLMINFQRLLTSDEKKSTKRLVVSHVHIFDMKCYTVLYSSAYHLKYDYVFPFFQTIRNMRNYHFLYPKKCSSFKVELSWCYLTIDIWKKICVEDLIMCVGTAKHEHIV